MSFCGGNLGFLIKRINFVDYNTSKPPSKLPLRFSAYDAIVENNDILNKS
jgi:hypothetical protein